MGESPRDPRESWSEVGRQLGELGRLLRDQFAPDTPRPGPPGPDPAATPAAERPGPTAAPAPDRPDATTAGRPGAAAAADRPEPADAAPAAAVADPPAPDPEPVTPAGPAPDRPSATADAAPPDLDPDPVAAGDPWAAATAGPDIRPGRTPEPEVPPSPTAGPDGPSAWRDEPGGGADWRDTTDPNGSAGWTGRTTWGDRSGGSARSDWTGRPGWGGRETGPAGGADWDAARESVRRLGESAQRFAARAGEAARDPELRESATRAARTVGDAVTTAVDTWVSELRNRMRSPRWSDPDHTAERPPVALEDDPPRSS